MGNDILEKYAAEVRSGGYIPPTHPDTEKNWPGTPSPDVKGPDLTEPAPTEKKGKVLQYAFIVFAVVLSAILLWLAFRPDPMSTVHKAVESVERRVADIEAMAQSIQEPEPLPPLEPAVTAFDVQLAQVKAWERIQNKLIHEFFSSKTRGTRALCISMGKNKKCASLDSSGSTKKARELLKTLRP